MLTSLGLVEQMGLRCWLSQYVILFFTLLVDCIGQLHALNNKFFAAITKLFVFGL